MAEMKIILNVRSVAAIILCLLCWPSLTFAQSGNHGDGHAQGHDLYKRWSPPGNPGTSCCNDSDCRPTRAYLDGEGRWRAWNGIEYLIVPRERILPADYAGDGRSHLCEKDRFIYCFSPAEPKI